MEITYLGHSSFKIKGKKTTLITDPFDSTATGLKFPKSEAGIVTVSHDHPDHNATSQVGGNPFIVNGPGEYEVQGVGIIGIPSFHDGEHGKLRGKNTIFHIEVDGVHILHLGDLGEMITDKEIEEAGKVDILFIPVGGHYTITAKEAVSIIKELEPLVVIPMHYNRSGLDQKVYGELTPISTFLQLMGKEDAVPVSKFSITKDKLPEQMELVVLE